MAGFYGLSLDVRQSTNLKEFETNVNNPSKKHICGISIPPHGENKDKDGNQLVAASTVGSAYITINNGNRNIWKDFPLASIVQATEKFGYFPLDFPEGIDFNNSFVLFGDVSNTDGKKFSIGFHYMD